MKNKLKRAAALFISSLLLAPMCAMWAVPSLAASSQPLKKRATIYTDAKIAAARDNIKKYSWAKSEANSKIADADQLLGRYSLEDIWAMIPSQKVFRSYGVNQTYGCLNCGNDIDAYGNYPYIIDYINDPWKVTCPSCGMKFPTNDYYAYYKSGLDENGIFQPSKADRSLLVNTLYPEKGEKWGVDDGTGYVAPDGKKYFFVAYYNEYGNWYGILTQMINDFYYAYLYTGEQKYADAGIVLLNRLADLYPTYTLADQKWADGYRHSGYDNGHIIGSIWECTMIMPFLQSYDAFFYGFETLGDDAMALLKSKSSKITSYQDIMINIENGLFKQIIVEYKKNNIHGNNGMHQTTLACAAVCLDDPTLTKQWLDFLFKPASGNADGGNVSATFINDVDRDAMGNEASPGYNSGWLGNYLLFADFLRGYKINGTNISYDIYENIKFKKMFDSMANIMATRSFTPNIGDVGSTGSHTTELYASNVLKAFCVYNEPKYAQLLDFLYNGDLSGLRLTIFDDDPEGIAGKVKAVIDEHGKYSLTSQNLTGYGFASLMNINKASDAAVYAKSTEIKCSDMSIISQKLYNNIIRDGDTIEFTPVSAGDSASLGFYLDNSEAVYDMLTFYAGTKNGGVFNVYVDGKLIEADVDFALDEGQTSTMYYKRTFSFVKGYHVLSLEAADKRVGSVKLSGLKFIKQSGEKASLANSETVLTMYYGRNSGHGHSDTLNIGLYAFGLDMMPDLGYPEFCDGTPNEVYWVSNTVSHNTVLVNDRRMASQIVSQPKNYDVTDFVKLVSVEANSVYAVANEYRRTTALIRIDGETSYAIDLFDVEGGKKHTYSFHPAESDSREITGMQFVPQTDADGNFIGTLAGKNVAWGEGNYESGYQYLDKVQTCSSPDSTISVDWSIVDTRNYSDVDNVHLKLTMLGDFTSAVLANGTPPRNKDGNPAGLDYLLVNREGTGALDSLFVSVIEPYAGESKIEKSELVKVKKDSAAVTDNSVKAVKVTFASGRVDYIVYSTDTKSTYRIDGLFDFCGFFAVYSLKDQKVSLYLNNASVTGTTESEKSCEGQYTGTVTGFAKELSESNFINVKFDGNVDASKLAGRFIYIGNDGTRNASYKIISAEKTEGDGEYSLNIGDITLIRSYKVLTDVTKGYTYDISEGRAFYIPLSCLSGDQETMLEGIKSSLSGITLSNEIRADAKPGDTVGSCFIVNSDIKNLYEQPEYIVSLDKTFGNGDMFDLNGTDLLLSDKYITGQNSYPVRLLVSYDGITQKFDITIRTLSKSQSGKQLYPSLKLSELAVNAEFPPEKQKEPSDINFIAVGAAVAASAAILGATAAILSKKRKKKEN
ncbi:MAG: heparinase II/III family protein [Oscillospiraceae bacterium]|nr:heparinase II/III family protein [Oscillospiraceae bacterium]